MIWIKAFGLAVLPIAGIALVVAMMSAASYVFGPAGALAVPVLGLIALWTIALRYMLAS